MVEFRKVHVRFKESRNDLHAVKGVSLKIKEGEIYGIVGTSGAGKSTLLRTINLLQPVTEGEVLINGENVEGYTGSQLRTLRQNVGMIFQHFNLAGSKTVYDNIAFALRAGGWKKEDIDRRVTELLAFVNLTEKRNEYPARLSGGQKQRVAIARALANNARILLCDEPTSALDPETTASVLKLLKEINQKLNITIIMITHELEVVKEICDRMAVMHDGEVVEEGEVYQIFVNPQHECSQQLVWRAQNTELPAEILETQQDTVLRLTYQGERATRAVLSEASRKYEVEFNILLGKIEYITGQPLGILYVSAAGGPGAVPRAVAYLKKEVEKVEEVYHHGRQHISA